MVKEKLIKCNYQPTILHVPVAPSELYAKAASNDAATINSWRHYWIEQFKANHKRFGPFKDRSIGKLHNKHQFMPAILVGSGPSLKDNAHVLKENPGLPVLSCLHNFHFLMDLGVKVDYWVSLDSGPITVQEVSEGGSADVDYWAKTKDQTLLAYVGSWPELLEKWQGEILFFNAPVPDAGIMDELAKTEKFNVHVSNGGNVLGAALYIAKGFLGCSTVAFLGADFSFGYDDKFHAWDSSYDGKQGAVMTAVDVFGNRVKTWPSYYNFKCFFDYVACQVPGEYVNCSEGGCFGAFPEGNIAQVKQMTLKDFFLRFSLSGHMKDAIEDPTLDQWQPSAPDVKGFKILY